MGLNAQHVWLSLQVFINPAVASLPQHAHLLAEPGCFLERAKDGSPVNRECGTGNDEQSNIETTLPDAFKPLEITEKMDHDWFEHIRAKVKDRFEEGAEMMRKIQIERAEKKRKKRNKEIKQLTQ